MKVLIIEDDPSVNYFLKEVAESAGHTVECAESAAEAFAKYDRFAPGVVLSDVGLPDMDGLQILEKIRKRNRDVIFIAMTGMESIDLAIRALELKANNFLQKPIRFEVINGLLQKYDEMLKASHLREEVSRMVVRRDLRMVLPTRLDIVSSAVELLVREASPWLNEKERFGIHLGLYELLTNAIEHGSLGISYEEKHRALFEGPYRLEELVARRMEEVDLAKRTVFVEFKQTNDRLEWTIEDEGAGFNWVELPNPLDSDNQERLNGRGIFLARFQFDSLDFIGNGNKVRVAKKIKPQPIPAVQASPNDGAEL